ncbi:MAG TPA: hypothetical protein PLP73_01375 [Candidatus Absconditabacterales bacterium]|nr:hypothetical protein [Candidatus Absconditabacterales bacterium]HRU50283.1 hypothetical protein [Candidatus Absconditabacterales bacterium]
MKKFIKKIVFIVVLFLEKLGQLIERWWGWITFVVTLYALYLVDKAVDVKLFTTESIQNKPIVILIIFIHVLLAIVMICVWIKNLGREQKGLDDCCIGNHLFFLENCSGKNIIILD